MDGGEEEVVLFRERTSTAPVYAARETGGAASSLFAQKAGIHRIQNLEDEWKQNPKTVWMRELTGDPREIAVPPYGAIMQWFVAQIG
jgi:hypothetical protein